ncbi:unnamed protein product [Protopolystoma xenopodis]|uniref:Uncharacterized protein n=1 Tax=Protopolystoma xenopodis TaxID=117903 RepID=A0A448WET2_9PLAT|nr:unnamed protein product [Protopolystoma xenopodis]
MRTLDPIGWMACLHEVEELLQQRSELGFDAVDSSSSSFFRIVQRMSDQTDEAGLEVQEAGVASRVVKSAASSPTNIFPSFSPTGPVNCLLVPGRSDRMSDGVDYDRSSVLMRTDSSQSSQRKCTHRRTYRKHTRLLQVVARHTKVDVDGWKWGGRQMTNPELT